MKKYLLMSVCILGLISGSLVNAVATELNFDDALGFVRPGEPAGAEYERNYVNSLVTRANGVSSSPYDYADHTYTLVSDPALSLPLAGLPSVSEDTDPEETDPATDPWAVDVTGYTYLLGKYDGPSGGSYVWYVAGQTDVTIPSFFEYNNNGEGQLALSHYSLFNPTGVPDGGATAALLGISMMALGYWTRRKV